ncbi:phosphoenolpyruvate-utilizing protein [Actinomadura sp. LD22]|uniref:Phosphoenolpyruvate-utilizing protein n=1 Tax=Actinomadura physcomitrii TaxID=2650748 RepID=A0A6I4MF90_9ACTN|nr:PEP-utilizing enzyme [Actinomadura physcomitrii]MWA03225.1 phosphoenolpyruvate-utilizing protein [Actinomadura physcomitrii]
MVDISRPWVVDSPISTRFPVYTRGNVGEVSSRVATPLFWSMIGGMPAEREWRRALAEFGAFDEDEFRPDAIDIQGMVHGYVYLNLSTLRVFGARMPGASPELMDRTYLGDAGGPAYVPHPDDLAPQFTERILRTVEKVFAVESRPDVEEDARTAARLRAGRPDFASLTDRDLVARQRAIMADPYAAILRRHLTMVYESSLVTGALDEALAPLDDPTLAVRLLSGLGDIASAAPAQALWRLGRMVAASPDLIAEFDTGTGGLLERLRARPERPVTAFLTAFEAFLREFGSRSTDEWEAAPATWETHPSIPLGLIDRMRLQPADREPELRSKALRAERERLTAQVRDRLSADPEAVGRFDAAMRSVAVFMAARELSKTNVIRVLHEARLPMWELGRRFVAAGHFGDRHDITMVREDELDALLDDPSSFKPVIAERWEWHRALSELEPPHIIDGEVPPVTTWPKRRDPAVTLARPGDVLTGLAACPGAATGPARIISDPSEATELEPGEILVAPMTDPGWTPLFTSAAAVVVNVGAPLSHAAIVSRELGIPCVLAVRDATKRIKNGTMLTVDGTAGTVTVH